MQHQHHEPSLNRVALMATVHCLTGCAIGEILGMLIGNALDLPAGATVALSIVLAFVFGYSFTSVPLLRAGMTLAVVAPLALASDTLSITLMEIVDNSIMLAIPGAMNAGLDELKFYVFLALALLIAGAAAFPLNRWLIARGKGHAVIHSSH
jgi:hypothetical protein